jgi:hypothetical protein
VDDLSALLIQKHLNGLVGVPYNIVETSLTGTEVYRNMVDAKTKWAGDGDDYLDESFFPRDPQENVVTLEAQRMRMFRITVQPMKPVPRPPSNKTLTE